MSIGIKANMLSNAFENATVDGYIRAGYEIHNVKKDDIFYDGALGGKLHIKTAPISNISIGASFYTSNSFGSADNRGLVPFRGEVAHSYSILGEAYFKALLGNTTLTLGRQEIETPFAQIDDIGIVPNTFEAYVLENKDIPGTTLYLGQIQKMAGVDAEVVDAFTSINTNHNMQVFGLTYEGFENLGLDAWYYHMKDTEVDSIAYIEARYTETFYALDYEMALQYANQTYSHASDSSIYGISSTLNYLPSGLTLRFAYNKVDGNTAFSGFGGGPFFSNSEYLIIDNAGKDATQVWVGTQFYASVIGKEGLLCSLGYATLKNKTNAKATELDFVVSYEINKHIEVHLIASNLKGSSLGEDDAKHLRIFANYHF